MRLQGRVALITGAGSGNGRAIAVRFAEEGATVALVDVDPVGLAATTAQVQNGGGRALGLVASVTERSRLERAVREAVDALGPIDVCVSNAGIARRRDFLDLTDEDWDSVLDVNLRGVFLTGQIAARVMVEAGRGGRIVNMGSVYAEAVTPGMTAYCTAKGGVHSLTKVMALELAPHNIRVNAIAPAIVETPMTEHRLADPAVRQTYLNNLLVGRVGQPIDVANAALYLASDDSDFMTGSVLLLDGGWTVR